MLVWLRRLSLAALSLVIVGQHAAHAGQINVTWDPVPGAAGYYVYYGVSSGSYGPPISTTGTSASITGLQDCQTYFVAVRAFNAAGISPNYSNEISGWSRPAITTATPASAMQGDQIVMDIVGANFDQNATVDLGNPNIFLTGLSVIDCTHIQVLATIEPTARAIRAAQVGRVDLTISNPDSVFGMKSQAFEVLINPYRFDVNQSDSVTMNRIDGKDTVYLSRQFGLSDANPNYDPDDDFDGDGMIDGVDLAYIASNLGRCWSSTTKSWSLTACPLGLQ